MVQTAYKLRIQLAYRPRALLNKWPAGVWQGMLKSVISNFLKVAKRIDGTLGLSDRSAKFLYEKAHDLDHATEFRLGATRASFAHQWQELPEGEYLLSDPWFRENVDRILSEQEILLDRDWFKGKKVLDAGCGSGRWAYGLSKLGTDLICADQAESALKATKAALSVFNNPQKFVRTNLEDLDQHVAPNSVDLAFSWGVLHHCVGYNKALRNVASTVKPGGMIYLYLYGRESISLEADIRLFKRRLFYNFFLTARQRYKFLLKRAGNDPKLVHNLHDIYAPIINRRFTFEEVKAQLEGLGFKNVVRTINHGEVFVRATKGDADYSKFELSARRAPYWFQGHHI